MLLPFIFLLLYETYLQIPSYAKNEGDVALIDIGSHSTTIGYIT